VTVAEVEEPAAAATSKSGPTPASVTVCGLLAALSATVSVPLESPKPVGVKVTLIVQLPPAATLDAHVLVWAKSELAAMPWMLSAVSPGFVKITVCGAVVVPMPWPVKFRLAGESSAPTWARAVAPIAEWVARTLSASIPRPERRNWPATRLTQGHRREAKGSSIDAPAKPAPQPAAVCRTCGGPILVGSTNCRKCARTAAKKTFIDVAKLGRAATHSPKAEALRGRTQQRQRAAEKAWNTSQKPDWLDENFYRERIQPALAKIKVCAIASALDISTPYASGIRAGKYRPHPRHWLALARFVSASLNE
jgi:hypothetical protein